MVKEYEPKMYRAVSTVFGDSYEYTKKYRQFIKEMDDKKAGKRHKHKLF